MSSLPHRTTARRSNKFGQNLIQRRPFSEPGNHLFTDSPDATVEVYPRVYNLYEPRLAPLHAQLSNDN